MMTHGLRQIIHDPAFYKECKLSSCVLVDPANLYSTRVTKLLMTGVHFLLPKCKFFIFIKISDFEEAGNVTLVSSLLFALSEG